MESDSTISNSCKHEQSFEIDGFLTCILCGIVIDEQIYENPIKNKNSLPQITSYTLVNSPPSYSRERVLLEEMLNRDYLSSEVCNTALHLIEKWGKENVMLKKFHLPYSIYYASKIKNFPICIKTISNFLGIDIKEFLKLEKNLPLKNEISPSKYIFKFGKILKLHFSQINECKNTAKILYEILTIQPIILAASVIFFKHPQINVEYLSKVTHVSIVTIKKWVKIFHEYV